MSFTHIFPTRVTLQPEMDSTRCGRSGQPTVATLQLVESRKRMPLFLSQNQPKPRVLIPDLAPVSAHATEHREYSAMMAYSITSQIVRLPCLGDRPGRGALCGFENTATNMKDVSRSCPFVAGTATVLVDPSGSLLI